MIVVVMPALNVESTIGKTIRGAKRYADKIIVVDDGCTDKTAKIARSLDVIVLTHKKNRGLGAALRTGFEKALDIKADIIFSIDSDGQHETKEMPKFIEKIKSEYGFVLGERDLEKYPFVKKFGNLVLNIITNVISGTTIKDTESGFRCFSGEALQKIYPYLKAEKYEIAAEIIFAVGLYDIKYTNVKIKSPVYVKGVTVAHGIRNFLYMIRRRKRDWKSYFIDTKYVMKKWLLRR